MRKKTYYVVTGSNGVAVMNRWSQALRIQKYYKESNIDSFDDLEEAMDFAYSWLVDITPWDKRLSDPIVLNNPVFLRNLKAM